MDTSVGQDGSGYNPATADKILSGYGAWVDGELVKGAMPNKGSVSKILDTSTTSFQIPKGYHDGTGNISVQTQDKTETAGTSAKTVTADTNKVLRQVTIDPTPSMPKTVNSSTSAQTVNPDAGKLLSSVTVNPVIITTPDEAKILSGEKVTVTSGGNNLKSVTGTMANYSGNNKKTYSITGKTINNGTISKSIDAGYHNGSTFQIKATNQPAYSISESGTDAIITLNTGDDNTYAVNDSTVTIPIETIKTNITSLNSSLIVQALKTKLPNNFNDLQSTASCSDIASSILNSDFDSKEVLLSKITGVSQSNLGTSAGSWTVPADGVYTVKLRINHIADSCPSGTGRYGGTIYLNGNIIESYSGTAGWFPEPTITKYLKQGEKFTGSGSTWCSDCSYSRGGETLYISVTRWDFQLS